MIRCLLFIAAVVVGTTSIATAEPLDLKAAAAAAISDDAGAAAAAIGQLRSAGPDGLAALIDAHRGLLEEIAATTDHAIDSRHARLKSAIDAVGAQRDCDLSRLYWYTDLASATDAARREGKPILSLRLL